jgi:hypothetical protein
MKISIDQQSRSLIAAGSSSDLNVAEALITKLDDSSRNIALRGFEVRVIWLATGLAGKNKGDPPSDDLKDLVAQLSQLGIKDPRQVGQMAVQTTVSGLIGATSSFEVKSSPRLGDQMANFTASGSLTHPPGVDGLVMRIKLRTGKEPSPPGQNLNELETQIVLPLNQYVVLATAPTGEQTSVFVVQVTLATKPGAKKGRS